MNPYARDLIEVLRTGECDECTHTGSMCTRSLSTHEIWGLAMEISRVSRTEQYVSYEQAVKETGKTKSVIGQLVWLGKVVGNRKKQTVSLSSLKAHLGIDFGNEMRA